MKASRYASAGLLITPLVALAIGVWAEFAHLTPPVLFVVSVPAIIVSTLSVAYLARSIALPLALVLAGAAIGTLMFGLAEGTHVAIALPRGSDLDFGDYHSRAAIAAGLIGVHLVAGAMVGASVGAALAALYATNAWVVRRVNPLS